MRTTSLLALAATAALPLAGLGAQGIVLTDVSGPASEKAPEKANVQFGDVIELQADGNPFRGILYPSPTMYDIDGDGDDELVIGDLRGYVYVSERKPNKNGQGWTFGEKTQLQVDGAPLKFHNW